MLLLQIGEPLSGCTLHLHPRGGDAVSQRRDLALQIVDQAADRGAGAEAGEAKHLRLPAGGAADVARAQHHQVGQFAHHRRIALYRMEEGGAGQRHQLAVAQRHDRRGVGRAGHHRHLAGRLAGSDDAQELRLLALGAADHAQLAGQQQVDPVRRLAGVEQHPSAGKREPGHVGRTPVPQEQARQGGVLDMLGQRDHRRTLT